MERLTERRNGVILDGRKIREHASELYWKLKEYEDAEEQGLLLRLPCEVGDTVFAITTCKDFEKVLDGTLYGANGEPGTATGYYCPYELSDSCPFESDFDEYIGYIGGCECFENKFAIFEDCIESIMICENDKMIFLENCESFSFSDFGKTIFLTKEEAEEALAKMKEGE